MWSHSRKLPWWELELLLSDSFKTTEKLTKTDEIIVFSNEENPFYNRVLLPEYMTGEFTWEQLLKIKEEALGRLNITTKSNVSIDNLNTQRKYHYR